MFNSSWPYTVSATYSTAANGQWLRPTNVLQSRFFKLGGHSASSEGTRSGTTVRARRSSEGPRTADCSTAASLLLRSLSFPQPSRGAVRRQRRTPRIGWRRSLSTSFDVRSPCAPASGARTTTRPRRRKRRRRSTTRGWPTCTLCLDRRGAIVQRRAEARSEAGAGACRAQRRLVELNRPAEARAAIDAARALAPSLPDHDRRHVDTRALQMAAEDDAARRGEAGGLPARAGRRHRRVSEDVELVLLRGIAESPDPAERGQGSTRRRRSTSSGRSRLHPATSPRITI